MIDIKSMTIPELEELLTGMGEKKFRAAQLFQWLHQKQVTTFDEMKNLPGKSSARRRSLPGWRPSGSSPLSWTAPSSISTGWPTATIWRAC